MVATQDYNVARHTRANSTRTLEIKCRNKEKYFSTKVKMQLVS